MGFELDYKEPPKAEKKGREPNPIYESTIRSFLDVGVGKGYALVKIPKEKFDESKAENPLQTFKSGLNSAIKRMKADNRVKVITRKDSLYLITKAYSDEQKWKWKITRT